MKDYLTKNELLELIRNSDADSKFEVKKQADYNGDGYTYSVSIQIINKAVSTYDGRW